ncbi:hypothetical protein HPB50_023214 [Hyalomma asiaticum]|uniref:Uncharacterized protein n=1 Tax=Hyalomma asiaticum TaxID=266040 RepID=A0ACB7SSM7_HYAAI|nr:hypothetical protein HPB50_023214 [Hyalomma asiaticum]
MGGALFDRVAGLSGPVGTRQKKVVDGQPALSADRPVPDADVISRTRLALSSRNLGLNRFFRPRTRALN